jgi:hypothetical protein
MSVSVKPMAGKEYISQRRITLMRSTASANTNPLETLMLNQNELTIEEWKRVAEVVTGEHYAIQGEPGHEEILLAIPHDDEWEADIWEPSFDKDAEDWQVAQAVSVLRKFREASPNKGPDSMLAACVLYDALKTGDLTASARAIIGGGV